MPETRMTDLEIQQSEQLKIAGEFIRLTMHRLDQHRSGFHWAEQLHAELLALLEGF